MSYIRSSWSRSAYDHQRVALFHGRQGPPTPLALWKRLFDDWQDRILANAHTHVACDPEDPSVILGYVIWQEPKDSPRLLHYVQTKRDLMRKGIASALLAHAQISRDEACVYTFTSPIQGKVKTPDAWVYVPYWLAQ